MHAVSLGYRTDLIFHRFDAEVVDRGDYLVVRTPQNPTFCWGNFLLFPQPPGDADVPRWPALFRREHPTAAHMALGWDAPDGALGAAHQFVGWTLQEFGVLSAELGRLGPLARPNREVEIRPLAADAEWEAAIEEQIACRDPAFSRASYELFIRRAFQRYRLMVDRGLGTWFGAFLDGRLVADLGIFVEDGVGRFQKVATHPDFRRRRICSTLVHRASLHAFASMKARTLVLVGDEHDHTVALYEAVGYRRSERQVGLMRR